MKKILLDWILTVMLAIIISTIVKKDDSYVYERETVTDVYQKYEVPEDSYFFLGDNRNISKDSRRWRKSHYIKGEDIIGKAQFRVYPFNRIEGFN